MGMGELPNEVLTVVALHISDAADLWALSSTCRRLRSVVEPLLYSFVVLRGAEPNKKLALLISERPGRASHVKTLYVAHWYSFGRPSRDDKPNPFVLPLLANLNSLYISCARDPSMLLDFIEGAVQSDHLKTLKTCESPIRKRASTRPKCMF
jgi:hypothetical protein